MGNTIRAGGECTSEGGEIRSRRDNWQKQESDAHSYLNSITPSPTVSMKYEVMDLVTFNWNAGITQFLQQNAKNRAGGLGGGRYIAKESFSETSKIAI